MTCRVAYPQAKTESMRSVTDATGKSPCLLESDETWEKGLPGISGQEQMDAGQTLGHPAGLSASWPGHALPTINPPMATQTWGAGLGKT